MPDLGDHQFALLTLKKLDKVELCQLNKRHASNIQKSNQNMSENHNMCFPIYCLQDLVPMKETKRFGLYPREFPIIEERCHACS